MAGMGAPSKATTDLYKSQKSIYYRIKSSMSRLKPAARKYFEDVAVFIDRYEAGIVKNIHDFYKTPEEVTAEWEDLSIEEFNQKIDNLYR